MERRSRLSRRAFVLGAAGLGLVTGCERLPGQAQQPAKVARIGYLDQSNASAPLEAFREGMRDLGYVEGQNLVIEARWGEGRFERLPALVAEKGGSPVDVIVTVGNSAASAARNATSTIPIVSASVADPVGAGLVASLARPGGNFTGLTADTGPVLAGKRLELLRDAVPAVSRVAVLWDPGDLGQSGRLSETEDAARAGGRDGIGAGAWSQ